MGTLDGRVALVTGAARGMGRSHAVRLAAEGADVIAVDICARIPEVPADLATPADLAETKRLVEAAGRRIVTGVADVRDRAGLRAAVETGVAQLGRLDIVVANAGTFALALDEPTDDAGREAIWNVTLGVNLTGTWNTVEVAVPFIRSGGRGGAIVMVSSGATVQTMANDSIAMTAYAASKFGVNGLMKMSAGDLARHDIRVNAVLPSGVPTPLIESDAVQGYFAHHTDLAEYSGRVYRPVSELDISEAVLYLVSDASKAVSGIMLHVDSGASVRWH